MSIFSRIRNGFAAQILRKLIPKDFCIISDDCWGGQLYRQLHIPYLTPTVGLFIKQQHYLRYIEEFQSIHQEELVFIKTDKEYPVATLSGIEIYFMHYDNEEEARKKYWERHDRIKNSKMLIKIDFGKPDYTIRDIMKWNELRINNSLALYPTTIELPQEGVFNGVAIPDWQLDGAKMFNISRRHFNIYMWLRSGIVGNSYLYRFLNVLLFDPTTPRRITRWVLRRTH